MKKTEKPKRGRPPGGGVGNTPLLNFRCPADLKEAILADKPAGESLTEFLVTAARERLKRLTRAKPAG